MDKTVFALRLSPTEDLTAKLSKCPIRFQEERNKRRDGVEKPIRGLAEKDCVDDTDGNPFCRPILSPLLLSLIQRERDRERERERERKKRWNLIRLNMCCLR